MAKRVTVRLTRHGPRQLRQLPEVEADLLARAGSIAGQAGPGMATVSMVGKTRARAVVYTATAEAMRAEADTRDLSRAILGGRLYTTKAGKVRVASDAQIANWTRGSR